MSNCQQCGKTNPPSKGVKPRKFCSKKCGKLSHYNRYKADGRYSYYTKKNPNWGEMNKEEKEDREKRRKEHEWCQEHMYDIRRIEKEYGMNKHTAWHRAKAHNLKPKVVHWNGNGVLFYTKEQAEKIVNDTPPPQKTPSSRLQHLREYRRRPEVRKRNAEYRKERLKNDPVLRLRKNVSALVYDALVIKQGKTKGGSTFEHLPYTPLQLKEHIENQFDKHMSWDNYGSYWQLDHIVPQAALIYDSLAHPNFAKCWALSNLQPLEKSKNASKGAWHEGKRHTYKEKN
jgi:endogenous inhibitor of DNA gyrase (YacG/DUF329 family)